MMLERFLSQRPSPWFGDEPIREELFGVERLEDHARSLARAQGINPRLTRGVSLNARLADNEAQLRQTFRMTMLGVKTQTPITPAAEWLVDNFHLVERHIRDVRTNLPPAFYRLLPKLAAGPFIGCPRVFGVAWAYVAHTDSRFDAEVLKRFMRAYQEVQPLTIGELWAVSTTLRIVLIENLRRFAVRIEQSQSERRAADGLVDRLLGTETGVAEPVAQVLATHQSPVTNAFAVQFVHRLHGNSDAISQALTWLDVRLADCATTSHAAILTEQERQIGATVTIRNIITSMRVIAEIDWSELFEKMSPVDDLLGVNETYQAMDFASRNHYRTAVEALARSSPLSEIEVAARALHAAGKARLADDSIDPRRGDPGYYLIAAGRTLLEAEIGYRAPLRVWPRRLSRKLGLFGYGTVIMGVAVLVLLAPALLLTAINTAPVWTMVLLVLGAIPALDAAVAFVNAGVTRTIPATFLPALELRQGVPVRLRTIVAVPVMLTSARSIAEQIETLEIHHLASLEGDVHFALLSDWADAPTETCGSDAGLLTLATEGIARLNASYPGLAAGDRFLLLHRRRLWSHTEGVWMGWERKRGKLHELNRLLRGDSNTTFITPDGRAPSVPQGVKFVITLDADTRLPRDTVRRLIGKLAHPLNRPRFDKVSGRVVEGHGLLQPRITPALAIGHEGSIYQQLFSSHSGIDPYSAAVSDVYQDLFGEGSYAGKGIYDIDAFEAALAGRVPDSTLLSHDLFEGVFARAGLATDVEVVEAFPERYDVASRRYHRWARGDWQLLPWILGARCGASSTVPMTGRAKMIDNLRRSLTAPAAIAALFAGWLLPLPAALVWTVFVMLVLAVPALIPFLESLFRWPPGISIAAQLRALGAEVRLAATRWALMIVFLADQAWLMGDAIGRTLFRVTFSRRNMLEWVPAAQLADTMTLDIRSFYRRMPGAIILSAIGIGIALAGGEATLPLALAFGLLWTVSPAVAYRISAQPDRPLRLTLDNTDIAALSHIARRTWRYFEFVVTPAENFLPPDNFQEDPAPVIARRTSPTNIGLYLLSVASARDFGWIGTHDAIERLEATMATLARLPRCRGHFYNWYDTSDCRVLDPPYVSSVDSGNLAGHLIALANACDAWREVGQDQAARVAGVGDAFGIFAALRPAGPGTPINPAIATFKAKLEAAVTAPVDWNDLASAASLAEAALAGDGAAPDDDGHYWLTAVGAAIDSHQRDLRCDTAASHERLSALASAAREMAMAMDFAFMLHPDRKLLSIGYSDVTGALDENHYDLLASEARLASFFAIAKGDAPAQHWFRLGHAVTLAAAGPVLVSWSGSMFEYLMPALVMRPPAGSLLERTECRVISRHIEYGDLHEVPWGISESAFNARDLEQTYQYSNFGVPGLGLKRGLGDDLVVAPYATALAAMAQPHAAIANFKRLDRAGAMGRYGYFDALDYTSSRLPVGRTVAIVRNFMAHHQGMTIVALANTVFGGIMCNRFHAEPLVKAAELLLQERMPRLVTAAPAAAPDEAQSLTKVQMVNRPTGRHFDTPHTPTPATHLLSNGRYTLMLTAAGSGFSRWRDLAVTRWREDPTCDDRGSFVFVRDAENGEIWSAGFQPTRCEPDSYSVTFNEDRAEFVRRDGDVTTSMTVLVSAEDDSEVRRISISNGGTRDRIMEITSYAELALAPQAADVAHPVFSKLFIETEHLAGTNALLARRRLRDPSDAETWAAHLMVVDDKAVGSCEFETDRAQFLGRGASPRRPRAIVDGRSLSGATGAVVDPAFILRTRVRVAPGETAQIAFWTMVGSSRQAVLEMVDKHNTPNAFDRAATLAFTQAQIQLHHLRLGAGEAARFQRLAGRMLYVSAGLRPTSAEIARGTGPQSGLWSLGISGDLPIIVLRINDIEHLAVARELVRATDYWRMKQLPFDLVIINERGTSYFQDLQNGLEGLVRASQSRAQFGERSPGTVYVLRADLVQDATRDLLLAVARVVIDAQNGLLAGQLDARREAVMLRRPQQLPTPTKSDRSATLPVLEFFNGIGGFGDNGREYVIVQGPGQTTPLPWINVIANPDFGFQTSADGAGFTWAANSREHQLTPWSNDPIGDPGAQAFYIRDDDDGALSSPTAAPIRDPAGTYVARHGWGYSRFEYAVSGLEFGLVEFVPIADPVKISRLTIRNTSGRTRRLSVAAYVDWALGPSRAASAPFTTTRIDAATGAMFATNAWVPAFAGRTAFFDLGGRQSSVSGDRREFIGRNGDLADPAAMAGQSPLSGRVGAGLDPCGAMLTHVKLADGDSIEIVCLLGEATGDDAARSLVEHYRAAPLDNVLTQVRDDWADVLGAVEIKTPDRSLDIMLNGWLLYQTLACRIQARAGFYQASGAYGFRDQLQDVMAVASIRPAIARAQIIRAAGRQFIEGDVQHWWLPQAGNGVRTRFADDRVWLALVTAHYLETTGDAAVLEESIAFLDGPALAPGEMESFFQPGISDVSASLYEHCARALDASLATGVHGLPLFGGGDWNDGMNRVGHHGVGESVWMGWFLDTSLAAFLPIAAARGDTARVAAWNLHSVALRAALDREAWDGDWYRRGWFDDGSPLGSATSGECRIDSIAQSWAVISGGGDPARARRAMASASRELISPETGLALLFAPPFDQTPLDPGYIKGYPPGIRENGGQYTHAALWSVIALTKLGEGSQAGALLAMLNPINHSLTSAEMYRYKVEPYVVAADIYSRPPNVGRGGWTWYTGAAGWMQRAGIEYLLGVQIRDDFIEINPCVPSHWPGFEINLRHAGCRYAISVANPHSVTGGIMAAEVDCVALPPGAVRIAIRRDASDCVVRIILGPPQKH